MKMKKTLCLALSLMMALSVSQVASAHGVWVATRLDKAQIVLGEGPLDNAYESSMVKSVQGYDAKYNKTTVKVTKASDHVTLNPSEKTAVIGIKFDYGYWSQGADGKFQHVPKTELKDAKMGMQTLKYNVSYLSAVSKVKAVPNMEYQIVPQSDPTKLKVGDKLKVQVVDKNKKPVAGAEIIPDLINHYTDTIETDAKGMATITIQNATVNVIAAEFDVPYTAKDKKADKISVCATLSFTVLADSE